MNYENGVGEGILNFKRILYLDFFVGFIKILLNLNKFKGKIIDNVFWMWFILEG